MLKTRLTHPPHALDHPRLWPWILIVLIIPLLFSSSNPSAHGAYALPVAAVIGLQFGFLDDLAKNTWVYLSSPWSTTNHLPGSWRKEGSKEGDYANTTEIGLLALSWIAAYDLGRPWSPTWSQTEAEVTAVLDQLRAWQSGSQIYQPNGPNTYQNKVFYQWYWIGWNLPVVGADIVGSNNQLVPSVDNAWLAASLMTIRAYAQANGHPALAQKAGAILADMDFRLWYHMDTRLFTWGAVRDPQDEQKHWYADTYSDENRIINFVARALGQMSAEEFRLSLQAMTQPSGVYAGIAVEKTGWDGSYFTYTTPGLFIRENLTPYAAKTVGPATAAQMRYAQNQGYTAWGFSDCYDTGMGGYVQAGAPPARIETTETRPGLVAPFAAALALNTPYSAQAAAQLQALAANFPCVYSETYGFHDSVMAKPGDPDYGKCSVRYSALAQEWLFLSLVNRQSGMIWRYFYSDPRVLATHCDMLDCGAGQVMLPVVAR